MSEWTPKVGDRVMVGGGWECVVSYETCDEGRRCHVRYGTSEVDYCVDPAWLSPAPEPEPDEPTEVGALVRNGLGVMMARDRGGDWVWLNDSGDWDRWEDIPSAVTVILADPAEVETLRERADQLEQLVVDMDTKHDELVTERDELRRRINAVLAKEDSWGGILYHAITQILRGEQ